MSEIEEWRDIEGYEGLYQVSNMGRVKSLNYRRSGKEKILKLSKDTVGYIQITLCRNNKIKCFRVHRLVAQAFLENPENLPCVNHKDENKENNHVSNLEYCTYEQNINYGTRNERTQQKMLGKPKTEEHKQKISEAKKIPILQYTLSGEFIREWDSATTATTQLNVDGGYIAKCCKAKYKTAYGYIWRYKKE